MLRNGKCADKYCYASLDLADLPYLEVSWEGRQAKSDGQLVVRPSDTYSGIGASL
jgi:hypothetical protein